MLIILVASLIALARCAPDDELITSLPNMTEPFRSKHYAGYLPIVNEKRLFYWYRSDIMIVKYRDLF